MNKSRIYSRIDHCLCNDLWMNQYGEVVAQYLHPSISDHCPILLVLKKEENGGSKPFKFFIHMVENPKSLNTVRELWICYALGRGLARVWNKLTKMKVA